MVQVGLLGAQRVGVWTGERYDLINTSASAVSVTLEGRDGSTLVVALQALGTYNSVMCVDGESVSGITAASANAVGFVVVPRDSSVSTFP